MKNKFNTLTKLLYLVLPLALLSCEDPDQTINEVFDQVTNGAVLRTVELYSGEFNSFDLQSSFDAEIEEQDEQDGGLLQEVKVYISRAGNEVLVRSLSPSDFSPGPHGLPRTRITVTLSQALTALGLSQDNIPSGESLPIRLELLLSDGRVFSAEDSSGSLQGSFFSSPFRYNTVVKCIPTGAVPGTYTFNFNDAFGDGYQGSHVKVTVDGVTTYYGIPSPYSSDADRNAILEPFTGNESSGKATLVIPQGASTMAFEFVSGDWPSEVSYTIEYSSSAGQSVTVLSEGPSPPAGEKILSICL